MQWVYYHKHDSKHTAPFLSIKLLLPIKKKKNVKKRRYNSSCKTRIWYGGDTIISITKYIFLGAFNVNFKLKKNSKMHYDWTQNYDSPYYYDYFSLIVNIFIFCSPFGLLITAVMRSDGFQYLKENCPALQSELLKTIAGCEEDCSSGGAKSRSVWAQLSDGGDTNGRRVRQRSWCLIVVL